MILIDRSKSDHWGEKERNGSKLGHDSWGAIWFVTQLLWSEYCCPTAILFFIGFLRPICFTTCVSCRLFHLFICSSWRCTLFCLTLSGSLICTRSFCTSCFLLGIFLSKKLLLVCKIFLSLLQICAQLDTNGLSGAEGEHDCYGEFRLHERMKK